MMLLETPDGYKHDAFRKKILNSEPDFKVKQDYYDWEMAMTDMADVKQDPERLRGLSH